MTLFGLIERMTMAYKKYRNKEGKIVPGTTTIIGSNLGWNKRQLQYWVYNSMKEGIDPFKSRDKAAEIGTLVHEYIEAHVFDRERDPEVMDKANIEDLMVAERGLQQFKQIIEENNYEVTHCEIPGVSEKYQYGGRIDLILNGNILADIKTSKSIYGDHRIQLAAYDNLLRENGICEPTEYLFFHISKDITKETEKILDIVPLSRDNIEAGWETFKMLRRLHDLKKVLDPYKSKKKEKK